MVSTGVSEDEHLNANDGLAVKGYDVVAYFSGEVIEGAESISSEHQGTTYRFASRGHKRLFDANPASYAPHYGGWCATAMASGKTVAINPESYKITDGKLYLFYRGWFGSAIKAWNKDEAGLTARADAAWSKVIAD